MSGLPPNPDLCHDKSVKKGNFKREAEKLELRLSLLPHDSPRKRLHNQDHRVACMQRRVIYKVNLNPKLSPAVPKPILHRLYRFNALLLISKETFTPTHINTCLVDSYRLPFNSIWQPKAQLLLPLMSQKTPLSHYARSTRTTGVP